MPTDAQISVVVLIIGLISIAGRWIHDERINRAIAPDDRRTRMTSFLLATGALAVVASAILTAGVIALLLAKHVADDQGIEALRRVSYTLIQVAVVAVIVAIGGSSLLHRRWKTTDYWSRQRAWSRIYQLRDELADERRRYLRQAQARARARRRRHTARRRG